jgi:probable rRNA maturation factor
MASHFSDDSAWYQNRQRSVRFSEPEFSDFLRCLSRDLARGREFAVVVASDEALRQANRRFRGKGQSTDVLSFPDGEAGRLGDILISARRADRQARQFGHRVEDELKVLALHGLMHLLGFDHETDGGEMRHAEKKWRKRYGLQSGLIERAEA